jgi:chromatin remodeling complex protein RSC6
MSKPAQTVKAEKPSRKSKDVAAESATVSEPAPVVEKEKPSRKVKTEVVVVPVVVPVSASASASATATVEASTTDGRKQRRQVTRESVDADFDELVKRLEDEITARREGDDKNKKDTRFLRSVVKAVRQLKTDSVRVSSKRARRDPNAPRSTNSGFMKQVDISKEMRKFIGLEENAKVSRVEVTKAICEYISKNNLQNEKDRRQFTPDEKLTKLLNTAKGESLTYYNLQSKIQHHFIKTA